MKFIYLSLLLFILIPELKANIIYTEPLRNSDYVSIYNNIIIGFDDQIMEKDPGSLIVVKGSLSGLHSGQTIFTSDRKKLIFKPDYPFAFNEVVEVNVKSVNTSLSRTEKLVYTFRTQKSRPEWDNENNFMNEIIGSSVKRNYGNIENLDPPVLTVNVSNNPSPGDLLLSNFPFIAISNTPYLLISDNTGSYSYTQMGNNWNLDFRRQPNGMFTYGTNGKFYVQDYQHILVDSFVCGNGFSTDNHDFQIIQNGHALMIGLDPQIIDMSKIVQGGNPYATVIGLVIQELDVNKNVIFQWRSLDYIPITDADHVDLTSANIDYIHANAIELDNDGNILISSRHLSEITKINRSTGEIIWRLGGAGNQFTFLNDTEGFSYQHDIRRIENGNITLFDNGNYKSPPVSRAVEYRLDEINKTATLVWEYKNNPPVYGFAMGSAQRLRNGNTLISWGSANPSITEVTPAGIKTLELNLPQNIFTYRVFRDEVSFRLNLKLAIEGFYDEESNKLSIKDTVTAYLRNMDPPYNIVDSSISTIDSLNFTGSFRFYNAPAGNYYISIKHRNSLETWSRSGGESFEAGGVYFYDFTASNMMAYGENLVMKGTKYCIYSGDVNGDGEINLEDNIQIINDLIMFKTGYLSTDIDGNNSINLNDILISNNNSINFVEILSP